MKVTIRIELRKDYVTKEGKQMVCLRHTAYRRSTLISVSIAVLPKHRNKVSDMVRSSEPRCYYYSKAISEVYQKADSIVMESFLTPLPIPQFLERLKDKYHGNTDFYAFIENKIEQLKQSRTAGTISNYYKLINTMREWKPALSFGEITLDFIQQFHDHELEVGNILSAAYRKHSNLKFLIDIAVDKGKLAKNPYEKFEIKKNIKVQNNDVLTEEELKRLQAAYDKKEYSKGKQEVLREFLSNCYTSLSSAEFSVLAYSDIKPITVDPGEMYLILCNERTKTSVIYKISIVPSVVVALLGNGEPCQKTFLPISNQPTNRYLKDIVSDLKIDKTMTFHQTWHSSRTIAAKKGTRDGIAERIMGRAEGNNIKNTYTHLHDGDVVKEMRDKWVV